METDIAFDMQTDANELPPLRVVFMGTPEFAVPALNAILEAGCDIIGVYTRPDRRSGRGKRFTAPPVKQAAIELGLPVFQPASLRRDAKYKEHIASLQPDLIVVAAYGLFLPADILKVPPLGALNIHPSLLPKHRGPSPVAAAILAGDTTTGATIMQLDEGMDTGPIITQSEVSIGAEETTEELTAHLFDIGANLLTEIIPQWRSGAITPTPQNEADATVSSLLTREDGMINWFDSAAHIARQTRAYHPWPSSFTHWNGRQIKVIRASPLNTSDGSAPGTVISVPQGIAVATGRGALLLHRVQIEGRQVICIDNFVRGYHNFIGSQLGTS